MVLLTQPTLQRCFNLEISKVVQMVLKEKGLARVLNCLIQESFHEERVLNCCVQLVQLPQLQLIKMHHHQVTLLQPKELKLLLFPMMLKKIIMILIQSSSDVIHTIVHPDHHVFEHTSKWTKDHPLENIIGALDRPVSTRL
ncbi:hypothetical protein Tco_0961747 [Tanacetum coccineum]